MTKVEGKDTCLSSEVYFLEGEKTRLWNTMRATQKVCDLAPVMYQGLEGMMWKGWTWRFEVILMLLLFACSVMSMSDVLWPNGLRPTRPLCPWDFPGENAGVGCHFLLKGISLVQKLNPSLLHWQADSFPVSHQGNPYMYTHTHTHTHTHTPH